MSHIGSAFLAMASRFPDREAIRDPEETLSFRQLANLVTTFALHFQANAVKRGALIGVSSNDPLVILASALAASLLGCGWINSSSLLAGDFAPRPDHRFAARMPGKELPVDHLPIDETWTIPPPGFEALAAPVFPGPKSPEDTCFIFSSSGTTGAPKFMEMTHRMINLRMRSNAVEFKGPPGACLFLFPQHSPPSLMRSICALLSGWALVFSDSPEFWMEAGVTHVFGSPLQIRQIVESAKFPGKFRKALIGGDNMSDTLARELLTRFETVVNTYGSTETNLILENEKYLADNGKVVTQTRWFDSELEIVDENGVPVPPGEEGTVRVRNDFTVKGYFGRKQLDSATFKSGWFYPGDVGILTADRNFFVTGRSKDIFNLGGTKINAMLIDSVLQSIEGIDDAICFMIPNENGEEELVAFVQSDGTQSNAYLRSQARIHVSVKVGREAVPKKIVMTDVIPRNVLGKPDREKCIQLAKAARAGDIPDMRSGVA